MSTTHPHGDVFDLLANQRRRWILTYLDQYSETPLRVLAEAIASREEDKPQEELTDEEVRRVYISLYQYHLPKMVESGVLHHDEQHLVSLTDQADVALAYLEFTPNVSPSGGLLSTARGLMGGE